MENKELKERFIDNILNIPIYVERSRSGNGAHIWIFFAESMPSKITRKMGNILLTKTMENASLDLESYDKDDIYSFIDKYKEDDYKEPTWKKC